MSTKHMPATQKERSRKSYIIRRDNGLCPACSGKLDRDGYHCSSCLEKYNRYVREARQFRRDMGFCPVCGVNRLFGDEKQCISCRQEYYKKRKPPDEAAEKRYRENFRQRQNALYKERAEKGICTRCGKRAAKEGKKKCAACLAKDAETHRLRRQKRMGNIK